MVSRKFSCDIHAFHLKLSSKLPTCVGLGSSGAYCVCMAAALLRTFEIIPVPQNEIAENSRTWDPVHLKTIEKWSSAAESLIHGRSSGLDPVICTHGGLVSFAPGNPAKHFERVPQLELLLVNSKIHRNTSSLVEGVRQKLTEFPHIIEPIIVSIGAISREATPIFQRLGRNATPESVKSDHLRLQELGRINNQLLSALGVGHEKTDHICSILAKQGINAKITGAGGGGCVFAFQSPEKSTEELAAIRMELKQEGYDVLQPMLGGLGVVEHCCK